MGYPKIIVRVGLAVIVSLFVSAALARPAFMNYYVRIQAAGKVYMIQSRANIAWNDAFTEHGNGFRYVFTPKPVSGDKKNGVMSFQVYKDVNNELGANPNDISPLLFSKDISFQTGVPQEFSFKNSKIDVELSFVYSFQG